MSKFTNVGFKPQKSLLAATIASVMAFAPNAVFAQDEAAEAGEEVERIAVTGSRIKRISFESASPVVTIDAKMMEMTGFSTVSDVLRNSSLNSFGSFGGGSNNGWSAQANIALKGVGAEKTLVLVDGVRLSKSPITGGSANLNMIPTAAVERIDILTDGASAVYGSDAVAGVINIILKKDFEGVEASVKLESPDSVDGADSRKYTFTSGISSDKGNMVFSWEHYEEDALTYADFDYAKAQLKEPGLDPEYIDNWHGISPTGRTIQEWRNGWADRAFNTQNNCDVYNKEGLGGIVGPLKRYRDDSMVCGYDWTQDAQVMPDTRRDSIMTSLSYELTDDITLKARGMWMDQTTTDVSAGDPAWFQAVDGLPEREITTADGTDLTLTQVDPWGWLGYRMNGLGNRVAEHNDNTLDFVVGLEGSVGEITWDLSANYARYSAFTWGTGYTSIPQLSDAIGSMDDDGNWSGWDPRDPDAELPVGIEANYDKRRTTSQTSIRGGLQFDIIDLPAGAVAAYVGASHQRETFYSRIDAQAEASNTGGGNGGSGGAGDRTVDAAFFELVIPAFESLEVNLAGRYDDYSDFGSTFNPSMSLSYRPFESLLLRASAGTGFQAPLLTDLYSAGGRGHESGVKNYIGCYLNDIPLGDECIMTDDYWATAGGNPDLQAEESENTNLGVVWQFTDNFSTTLDYWTLETEQLVDTIHHETIQKMQIKLWEAHGMDADIADEFPGVDIDDDGNNTLGEDRLGEVWFPQDRVNATLAWTYDDHSVSWYTTYVSSQEDVYLNDDDEPYVDDSLDSFMSHNLTYTYHTPWSGKLSAAVLNVFDEVPPRRLKEPREPFNQLYDIRQRVFTVTYTQTF